MLRNGKLSMEKVEVIPFVVKSPFFVKPISELSHCWKGGINPSMRKRLSSQLFHLFTIYLHVA